VSAKDLWIFITVLLVCFFGVILAASSTPLSSVTDDIISTSGSSSSSSKLLGQDITKYRSLFPHVSAAIQLSNEDTRPSRGDIIKYIYKDSQHKNPLYRVASIDSINDAGGKLDYDKEKYKEMILLVLERGVCTTPYERFWVYKVHY
jgi:hypothetical protein